MTGRPHSPSELALQGGFRPQLQDPARLCLHGGGWRGGQSAAAQSAQQHRMGDNREAVGRRDGNHRAAHTHGTALRAGRHLHGGRQDAVQPAGGDSLRAITDEAGGFASRLYPGTGKNARIYSGSQGRRCVVIASTGAGFRHDEGIGLRDGGGSLIDDLGRRCMQAGAHSCHARKYPTILQGVSNQSEWYTAMLLTP